MSDGIRRAMDPKSVMRPPAKGGRMQAFTEAARQQKVRDALDKPLKAGSETTMRWHLMLVDRETEIIGLKERRRQLEEWQNIPGGESPVPEQLALAEARVELLTEAVLAASRGVMGWEGQCPHDVGHEKAPGRCEHDWADWFELEAQRTLDMFQRMAQEHKAEKERTTKGTTASADCADAGTERAEGG